MSIRPLFAGAFSFGLAMARVPAAMAHPGYPAIVDSVLGLSAPNLVETVYPPMGCELCHHSAAGGDELRDFGSLLVTNYGLGSSAIEDDPSLETALMGLEAGDQPAVKDLKSGADPNSDSVALAGANPKPQYGCIEAATGSDGPPPAGLVFVLAGISAGVARRRMSRSRS